MRRKDGEGKPIYCSPHQNELKKHKESHPCGITCEKARQIQKEIKECDTCQNPELFIKQIRKQIKCKQVVDLLKIKKEENKENLLLFLIKKDNNCEKKVLTATKTQISSDSKLKKTVYCKKHWLELERLEKHKTKAEKEVREEKEIMEERIIKSTLSHEIKTEILKDLKIISGSKNKEIMKKIANSPVDLTISEVAVQEQIQDLKQKGTNYQKKSVEYKNQQEKIESFKKNKVEQCPDCQKYCSSHKEKNTKLMAEHKTCKHCHKYDKQIQQLKAKKEEVKKKLETLQESKPGATKEIKKLVNELEQIKKQSEELRNQAFGSRAKCPILNELKVETKECLKCQDQEKKKHRAPTENPLLRACLVKKEITLEIYLLVNEDVC